MIVQFKNSNFEIYEDRYRNRIETSNDEMELLIRDLGEGDSGVYHQTILFANKKTQEFLFNLTVYEPVPSPVIKDELEKKTAVWCNLTLRCSVPLNTSALSISWLCRYKDSECCNRTACDNNNGSAVQLSLQPGSWDMEIMCLVQNPADRKNVSFHTRNICLPSENKSTMKGRSYHIWIPILLGVLLLMIIIFSKWKRKRKGIPENRADRDDEYFDVETFRGGRDQNVVDKSEENASTHEIVYSKLQHPELSSPT
ncbi:SLAM family member 5-like [Spea bombifrons]|uniref:SLAM family member 5-like n=1 Tax=Spea bombifrons TaxID=233779 RepID=UPI00234BDC06|nr:SLAM family member 5-like [Spea bombifrons]